MWGGRAASVESRREATAWHGTAAAAAWQSSIVGRHSPGFLPRDTQGGFPKTVKAVRGTRGFTRRTRCKLQVGR